MTYSNELTISNFVRAAEILDAQDAPMHGRYFWLPEEMLRYHRHHAPAPRLRGARGRRLALKRRCGYVQLTNPLGPSP